MFVKGEDFVKKFSPFYLVISDFFRNFATQLKKISNMTYSLTIERNNADPTYVNDIKTWDDVLDYLKHKLDQWTIRVHIYKWSSNSKCLGERCVTMGNMWFICFSETDKVLI